MLTFDCRYAARYHSTSSKTQSVSQYIAAIMMLLILLSASPGQGKVNNHGQYSYFRLVLRCFISFVVVKTKGSIPTSGLLLMHYTIRLSTLHTARFSVIATPVNAYRRGITTKFLRPFRLIPNPPELLDKGLAPESAAIYRLASI